MTDAVYSNGDTVTFANGDVATFGHASEAHTETNDRVALTPELVKLPAGVKPIGPVEIDWDHPLARGLSLYLHRNPDPEFLVGDCLITNTGTVKTAIHPKMGQCMLIDTAGSQRLDHTGYGLTTPFTIVFDLVKISSN